MSSRDVHPAGSARGPIPTAVHLEGTYFQGHLLAFWDELIDRFGHPHFSGDGDGKTRAEWVLQTKFGIATIYDFKDKDLQLKHMGTWHVGGTDERVVGYLQAMFP
jgi:hypothetical protein